MSTQGRSNHSHKACIYLLANHIGRPEDISLRSLELLKSADLVVFEEHKSARQSLKAAGVHRDYLLWNEHQSESVLEEILLHLKQGASVTYMSDQGCPSLADPAGRLSEKIRQAGFPIDMVPGPSSLTAAICLAPFPISRFYFAGFCPVKGRSKERFLKKLKDIEDPIILFETPYRRQHLLKDLKETLGPERTLAIILDICGNQQKVIHGSFQKVMAESMQIKDKLNFVLIVAEK